MTDTRKKLRHLDKSLKAHRKLLVSALAHSDRLKAAIDAVTASLEPASTLQTTRKSPLPHAIDKDRHWERLL